jgi:hypothetical protein
LEVSAAGAAVVGAAVVGVSFPAAGLPSPELPQAAIKKVQDTIKANFLLTFIFLCFYC